MFKKGKCTQRALETSRTPVERLLRENGQSTLECALVIGLLLLFTFTMIDFSRFIYVAAAAQASTRFAIGTLHYGNVLAADSVQNAVRSQVIGLDPQQAHVIVSVLDAERVQVTVTYEFNLITPLPMLAHYVLHDALAAGPWPVRSTASMQQQ